MRGPGFLAWLVSSLGAWRVGQLTAGDSSDCQRTEHPVIPYTELFFIPVVGIGQARVWVQASAQICLAVEWGCDEPTKRACYSRGKSTEECQNYVRVLLVGGDRLFTCGTNAFTPLCTNRTLSNLSEIHEHISGMARCPYSPQHNSTALLTASGELYAATAMDFPGRDPAIYRSLGTLPPLRTAQYNSKWLNEPPTPERSCRGRLSAPKGTVAPLLLLRALVLVFRVESSVPKDSEHSGPSWLCVLTSPPGRKCENPEHLVLRPRALGSAPRIPEAVGIPRFNCSRPGELPFTYNELQSTFLLPELHLLYGVFTTNVNSIAASAVCVFNLSAIDQAFRGPFKYQENSRSAWLPYPNPNPRFQCGTVDQGLSLNLTERSLQDAQRFILMQEVVQPVSEVPAFMEDNSRLSHVVVDVVQARDLLLHIMYLATDRGTIKKVRAALGPTAGSCLLEELELVPARRPQPVRSLLILHSQSVLYVGLHGHVARVPLRRCHLHLTHSACVGAHDPYCGWDMSLKKCTSLEESVSMAQWEQNLAVCPAVGSCLCRTRSCDSPAPQCGGWSCAGPSVEIANCSRNGGWTPWSPWSPCSTTCGIGFQVRQRACSNPTPRHGGRVCVGQNREERYCNEHLLCPPHVFWTGWGPWERCTAQCGGGIQARRRTCENGPDCSGCDVEYQPCNTNACPELKKTTPWTPWTPVNISDNGGHYEQRFRYTCKARLPDPSLLDVGRQRIEMRYCSSDGASSCSTDGLSGDFLRAGRYPAHMVNGAWSAWTSWSQCSRDCSRGIRSRKRVCNNPEPKYGGLPCLGPALEYQECNVLPCPVDGMWSCWSPWSKCSATCGGGHYMRTRSCSNPAPAYGGDICLGLHTEEALCSTQPCPESWSTWSAWSMCDASGIQVRSRQCVLVFPTGSSCSGNSSESRPCFSDSNLLPGKRTMCPH
ncbi:semaphorin-5A [Echinops telfairi]|uniref:Semaphorin-5A n=1 Tax=Echinops telfairi TaxID=9371 RepID=A0AC55CNY6_ECHTE|nr:semaphorin-5A [Echinops telfairi]